MSSMNEQLDRIEQKIGAVQLDVAKNTKDLEHHIKRTEAAETRITYLERILMGLAATTVLGGVITLAISALKSA